MEAGSFYSIDRLVEFGLSVGIATQMANSMNVSLQSMQIPGARNNMQASALSVDGSLYYAVIEGGAVGPLSVAELSRLIDEGRVTKETYIWKSGMPAWKLAEEFPEVLRLVALTPPPVPKDLG